jgi:uncharacterized protein (TIGR02421 family)
MSQPMKLVPSTPSETFIERIQEQLSLGKKVRDKLPAEGRLHIDRPLPFLCVYRRSPQLDDPGMEQLVISEAAHLIGSGDLRFEPGLARLVQTITQTMTAKFKGFLLMEIWAAPRSQPANGALPHGVQPAFRIITSPSRPPTTTIEALAKALRRIKIHRQGAKVEVVNQIKRTPPQMSMLISSAQARRMNCFVLGLEVQPVYRDPDSGRIFPVLLRTLHRGLARALRRAFFEFSRTHTTYSPPNYLALGRRALVRSVWHVDRQLAEIGNSFDFLLQVTPINPEAAWLQFKQQRFDQAPIFYYRPLPIDPAMLKRRLYNIAIERIEDPTLAYLFREKRHELDRQLSMLEDRGTTSFLLGSLQIFGGVSDELSQLANALLSKISPRSHENLNGGYVNAMVFAERARAELDYYRQDYPELAATVQIRDDIAGLMVSRGNLLVSRQTRVPQSRVEALLQHEIGTHVLTYFNGKAQPFQQLYAGLAGYEELQEGLAVLAEFLVGGLSRPRLRLLAGRVVAAQCLIEGATFIDTYRVLYHTYGFSQRIAFTIAMRIYRGGGLTKDAVYLRGLVAVLKYIAEGGQLDPLFVGKIAADHVPIIKELQWRQVLRPTPLYPRYMRTPDLSQRLAYLRQGVSVLNLLDRKKL